MCQPGRECCEKKKLKMTDSKTQAILLKGKAEVVIYSYAPTEVVIYLGGWLGRGFNISPHLEFLGNRVTKALNGLFE